MDSRPLHEMEKSELVAKLERSNQFEILFHATETAAHIGHYEWDIEQDRLNSCSEEYARLFGMTIEEVMEAQSSADKRLQQIHPEDRDYYQSTSKSHHDDNSLDVNFRIIQKNGDVRNIREIGIAVVDHHHHKRGSFGMLQDITTLTKHQNDLESRDALARQAEQITDIGHYIYDEEEEIYLYASPGCARIFGQTVQEMLQTSSTDDDILDIHEDDRQLVLERYRDSCERAVGYAIEYRVYREDGLLRWIRELGKPYKIRNGRTEQTLGVIQDITVQKDAEKQLQFAKDELEITVVQRTRELSRTVELLQQEVEERKKIAAELKFLVNHDALTGLPSLRLCKDRIEHSLAEARRSQRMSAVMFIDLDGFKAINDSFGHEFGDTVLKISADRIKAEIREIDTVARIGGDEFVVVISSVPEVKNIKRIAANMVKQVSQPIQTKQGEARVGASIGVAIYPQDSDSPDELIRQADNAMYLVKHSGKSNFRFASPDQA